MTSKPVPLYERLPEIYRIRDSEQPLPYLQAYLGLFEYALGAMHGNIAQLYRDLFIETCEPWAISYIGGLLGTSVLKADEWTLRADVADTIALRRRKGTIGAVELLAYNLTKWGAHVVELRENLAWHQHVNHLRPDAGGVSPFSLPGVNRNTIVRGGTVPVRSPGSLSLLGTPFDPYAYTADTRPPVLGAVRINLPNLGIFLWRLTAFRAPVTQPLFRGTDTKAGPGPGEAGVAVRFEAHPLGRPVVLFNTPRYNPDAQPPEITEVDETPNAIPAIRLTSGAESGNPVAYVSTGTFATGAPLAGNLTIGVQGLQFHFPVADFAGNTWTFRGANLCAWETPLLPKLKDREILIDPVIGRFVVGVATAAEALSLEEMLITYTYGAPGPVGSHPISRPGPPDQIAGEPVAVTTVRLRQNPNGLRDALANLDAAATPLVVEIDDSFVHDLDPAAIVGAFIEGGQPNLRLNRSLVIRATSGNRPIIRLAAPLRFRPRNVVGATAAQQTQFDAVIANMSVRLEGLYFTRGAAFPAGEAMIERAAVNRLEMTGCTFEPDGHRNRDKTKPRAPIQPSLRLRDGYDFTVAAERAAFQQTPDIVIDHAVTGPLWIDQHYTLAFNASIVDAGKGVEDDATVDFAISGAASQATTWGPPMQVAQGLTVFGRTRVESANGRGGVWVHRIEVLNNQKGCLKFSYFSGEPNRLPQTFACVRGPEARLAFTAEAFGEPGYAQLSQSSDFRILERGPGDDQMGAFGFLLEAHRWHNLQIRVREFLPAGVRPVFVAVT